MRWGITVESLAHSTDVANSIAPRYLGESRSRGEISGATLATLGTADEHRGWSPEAVFRRGAVVRGITGTLVILFCAGYLASTVELPRAWSNASGAQAHAMDGWRRTATGWEWQRVWKRPQPSLDPPPVAWRIHPFTLASMQVLISLFALVWADRTVLAKQQPAYRAKTG